MTPLSRLPWAAIFAIACAGGYFGTTVATVPLSLNYYAISGECNRYDGADGCHTNPTCAWVSSPTPRCTYRDVIGASIEHTCGNVSRTKAGCNRVSVCQWEDASAECRHIPAWSALRVGLFAAAATAGGTASTIFGSLIISVIFRGSLRWAGVGAGVVALLGTVLTIVGWVTDSHGEAGTYSLIMVGRFLAGVAAGLGAIVGPLVASLCSPPQHRTLVAALLGPSMSFLNLSTAGLSLVLDPTRVPQQHLKGLYAALSGTQLLMAIGLIIAMFRARMSGVGDGGLAEAEALVVSGSVVSSGVLNEEDALRRNSKAGKRPSSSSNDTECAVDGNDGEVNDDEKDINRSLAAQIGRMGVGVCCGVALQMTGITAVFAYAPRMAQSAGLSPLLGNFFLMLWNALTVVPGAIFAQKFTARRLFLGGTLASSIACIATGVPTLFYESTHGATRDGLNALTIIGILCVIATYEFGQGVTFYVIAQSIFPQAERRRGTSLTVATCFTTTLIINFAYAPLQSMLSGYGTKGSQGSERQGQGWLFVIFGASGIVLFLILLRTLHPFHLAASA